MSTSVQQHQGAVVNGVRSPDRGGLLSRCQESWSRIQCRRPSQAARLIQPTDRIRPLAVLAWGLALLALLPHLLCEALASGFVGGPDFPINNYTTGFQRYPSVSGLSGGGFVVTWSGARPGGESHDISGRIFDSSRMAVGPDFPVNTYTTLAQWYPSVSALSGGGFVVTWFGRVQGGSDSDISGRLYDASGMAVGSDFPINTCTTFIQQYPSVSGLTGGGFVVTWSGATRQLLPSIDIVGRLFGASGMALGSDFRINTYTGLDQISPSVSGLSGGGFVVTWSGYRQGGFRSDIFGRLYKASGVAVGPDFFISIHTTGDQFYPSVSGLSGGGFVVTWQSEEPARRQTYDISGRLYNASGVAVSSDFPINTNTTGDQQYPSVSGLSGGGFVVTWRGSVPGGSDYDISGRLFDASGLAAGPDFPISTYTGEAHEHPSVSALSGGGFVVVWRGITGVSGRFFTLNGTTAAPTTTEVMGGTTSGQGGKSTATTSPLMGATGATTASKAVSPQPSMDSSGPALAAGVGAGAAALVCSLLSALGAVLLRRRQFSPPANAAMAAPVAEQEELAEMRQKRRRSRRRSLAPATQGSHDPDCRAIVRSSPAAGESQQMQMRPLAAASSGVSSLTYGGPQVWLDQEAAGAAAARSDRRSLRRSRSRQQTNRPNSNYRAVPVNGVAMYGHPAEKTDGRSSARGAAYGHVLQNGGAMYGQLAEKTGGNSPPVRVVYTGLREKTDGSSS